MHSAAPLTIVKPHTVYHTARQERGEAGAGQAFMRARVTRDTLSVAWGCPR